MGNDTETQPAKTSDMGILKRFFHHPNFNVVCGIVTIVSAILAIYFYLNTIKEPNLTFYISSTRTPIVQKGNLNDFSVTFHGIQITNDLSSAEIQIWNQGKAPIRKDDILKPMLIKTPKGEPIYQAVYASTRDVIEFNWIGFSNKLSGVLQFDWKILEKNDGIKIQIVYGGNVLLPLIVDGINADQPQGITKYTTTPPRSYLVFLVLAVILAGLLLSLSKIEDTIKRTRTLKYGLFVFILTLLGICAWGWLGIFLIDCIGRAPKLPF